MVRWGPSLSPNVSRTRPSCILGGTRPGESELRPAESALVCTWSPVRGIVKRWPGWPAGLRTRENDRSGGEVVKGVSHCCEPLCRTKALWRYCQGGYCWLAWRHRSLSSVFRLFGGAGLPSDEGEGFIRQGKRTLPDWAAGCRGTLANWGGAPIVGSTFANEPSPTPLWQRAGHRGLEV